MQALGGAKNHMVVLPDADLDLAADAAVSAAYGSAGERCMAVSVVVAVGGIADTLVDAIAARLPKLRIGAGTDPDSEMGPLITREHRDKVACYVGPAPRRAPRSWWTAATPTCRRDGFFLGVTLLDHVTPGDERLHRRDLRAGAVVVRADTYAEAVDLVNANPYGNGAAIFTRDGGAARQFQFDVEAGMVGVNVPIPVPVALLLVRRLEGLAVRRHPHVRPGRRPLLHPRQGGHHPLARPGHVDGRPRLPAHR